MARVWGTPQDRRDLAGFRKASPLLAAAPSSSCCVSHLLLLSSEDPVPADRVVRVSRAGSGGQGRGGFTRGHRTPEALRAGEAGLHAAEHGPRAARTRACAKGLMTTCF